MFCNPTLRGNAWLGVVDVDEEQVYTCIGEEGRALTYTNWYQRFGIWAVPEPDNMVSGESLIGGGLDVNWVRKVKRILGKGDGHGFNI